MVNRICGVTPPEPARKPTVTIEELIRRGRSHVRLAGKLYRIEVTDVTHQQSQTNS